MKVIAMKVHHIPLRHKKKATTSWIKN